MDNIYVLKQGIYIYVNYDEILTKMELMFFYLFL